MPVPSSLRRLDGSCKVKNWLWCFLLAGYLRGERHCDRAAVPITSGMNKFDILLKAFGGGCCAEQSFLMAYAHRQFKLDIVHVRYIQHTACGVHITCACLGRYINGDEVHPDGTAVSVHVSS